MTTPQELGENAQLAADVLAMKPARGIPSWLCHVMDTAFIENVAGHPPGAYRADPDAVYLGFQRAIGTCMIDQYLADNPLTMADHGFGPDAPRTASTGADRVILDGVVIDSPEAVAEHLERFVCPALEKEIAGTDPDDADATAAIVARERAHQERMGPAILKAPHGGDFNHFPYLRYTQYGYANYLTAYAVYPDVMEKDFALQADLAERRNARAARAIVTGRLPRVVRLDHDMADSRGTLVDVRTLDKLWFPHFTRSIRPYLDAGVRLLWHCDGDLMAMLPRLIEAGVSGFQGFQYEDGMDYEAICRMRTRAGDPLMIWAGVSVTRTLPFGTPADIRRELTRLARHGPPVGLFLGASSSITPGVPWKNLETLIEGLVYFRTHGRADTTV